MERISKGEKWRRYTRNNTLRALPNEARSIAELPRFRHDVKTLYKYLPTALKNEVRSVLFVTTLSPLWSQLPKEIVDHIASFLLVSPYQFHPEKLNNDGCGLFYFLGTKGYRIKWKNPTDFGYVIACASSIDSGNPNKICGRKDASGYTKPEPNSWISVSLASGWFYCTGYSFTPRKYGGTPRALRDWEFQGSKDGFEWVCIGCYVEDETIPDTPDGIGFFTVDCKGHLFRHFKIVQTGPNAYVETYSGHWQDNYAQLNFGNLELYGSFWGDTPFACLPE